MSNKLSLKAKASVAYTLAMVCVVTPAWSQNATISTFNAEMDVGRSHFKRNQFQEAKINFDNALKLCPNPFIDGPEKGDCLLWAGFTELKLGNLQNGFASFQKAIACANLQENKKLSLTDGSRQLGIAAMNLGQWDLAQGAFDLSSACLNQLPTSTNRNRYLLNTDVARANLFEKQNKFDSSESLYKQVIKDEEKEYGITSTQYGTVLHNYAFLKTREGDWKEAIRLYKVALNCYDISKKITGNDLIAIWEHLAEAQAKCLQNSDAQQSYLQAVSVIERATPIDEAMRAKDVLKSCQIDIAAANFASAQSGIEALMSRCCQSLPVDSPTLQDIFTNLAESYLKQSNKSKARNVFFSVIEKLMDSIGVGNAEDPTLSAINNSYSSWISICISHTDFDEAKATAQLRTDFAKKYFGAGSQRYAHNVLSQGVIYLNNNDLKTARSIFNALLSEKDAQDVNTQAMCYFNLGMASKKAEAFDAALKYYQKSLTLSSDKSLKIKTQTELASVYQALGQYDNAASSRSVMINPSNLAVSDENLSNAEYLEAQSRDLSAAGNYDEAEPAARRSLAIRRKLTGPTDPALIHSLDQLGIILVYKRSFTEGESILQEAVALSEKSSENREALLLLTLNDLSVCYSLQQQYAKVVPLLERVLSLSATTQNTNDKLNLATANFNLGEAYSNLGRSKDAESAYSRCYQTRQDLLPKDSKAMLDAMITLEKCYFGQAKYVEAEPLAEKVVAIRSQSKSRDDKSNVTELIRDLNRLARIYYFQRKMVKALGVYKEVMDACNQNRFTEDFNFAQSLEEYADCLIVSSQAKEGQIALLRASAIFEKLGKEKTYEAFVTRLLLLNAYRQLDDVEQGTACAQTILAASKILESSDESTAALGYLRVGSYYRDRIQFKDEVATLLKKALAFVETKAPKSNLTISILDELGSYYLDCGDTGQAEKYLLRANELLGTNLSEKNSLRSNILSDLGNVYSQTRRYNEAAASLSEAIFIKQAQLGSSNIGLCRAMVSLAFADIMLGLHEKAKSIIDSVLSQIGPLSNQNAVLHRDCLVALSTLHYQEYQYAEAETATQRALKIQKDYWGANSLYVASLLSDLANIYDKQKLPDKVVAFRLQSIEVVNQCLGPADKLSADKWHALADAYAAQNKLIDAKKAYERELEIRKQLPDVETALITSLQQTIDTASPASPLSGAQASSAAAEQHETVKDGVATQTITRLISEQKFAEAIEPLKLALAQMGPTADPLQKANFQVFLARSYAHTNKTAEALQTYQQLLVHVRTLQNLRVAQISLAAYLDEYAGAQKKASHSKEALDAYEEEIKILASVMSVTDVRLALAHVKAAECADKLRSTASIVEHCQSACRIFSSFSGKLTVLDGISATGNLRSNPKPAYLDLIIFLAGLPDNEPAKEEVSLAYAHYLVADYLSRASELLAVSGVTPASGIIDTICSNLKMIKPPPFMVPAHRVNLKQIVVLTFIRTSAVPLATNDFGRARYILDMAMSTVDESNPEDNYAEGTYLRNLADLSNYIGDDDSTITLANRAMQKEPSIKAGCLGLLSQAYESQGRLLESLTAAKAALTLLSGKISASEGTDERWMVGEDQVKANCRAGTLSIKLGKLEEAKSYFSKALLLSDKTQQPAVPLIGMASYESSKNNYAAAKDLLLRAVSSVEMAKGSKTEFIMPELIDAMRELAIVQLKQNDFAGATATAMKLAASIETLLKNDQKMSLTDQVVFVQKHVEPANALLLSISVTNPASVKQLYPFVLRWKGLIVNAIKEQALLSQSLASQSDITSLRDVGTKLSGSLSSAKMEELTKLQSEKDALERRARQAITAGSSGQAAPLSAETLTAALANNECFIDIYKFSPVTIAASSAADRYVAIVSNKNSSGKLVDLGLAGKLDQDARLWNNTLADCHTDYARASRSAQVRGMAIDAPVSNDTSKNLSSVNDVTNQFLSEIWSKLQYAVPAAVRRINICPDGEIGKIPWNSMIGEVSESESLVTLADSPRSLVILRTTPGAVDLDRTVLLAGNIAFGDAPQLPATKSEVEGISLLANSKGMHINMLQGTEPSKQKVLSVLPNCTYVHLATHGYFATAPAGSIKQSTTQVAYRAGRSQGRDTDLTTNLFSKDPLLVSGILLAPSAADASGRLNAEEMIGIDLSKCELLTLSACQTGLGEAQTGQGVIGLRAAIAAAGCKSILMSLWKVDDASTQALMQEFYKNIWERQMVKAEALKRAQDYVRSQEQWHHPYYWAAWILSGENW